ncbi:ABC transporter permease [Psychrobacillus sp. PGGUH221]|uniref:ABC transporter permease n=1 Tax=Psychrobacillus sp. PGGUH221 TaxID=3020058 RepID=UPI0035C71E38
MFNIIWASTLLQAKQSFARPTFKFIILFQPVLYSCLFFLILKENQSINIGEYIIVSVGLINLWSTIINSSASDIERERYMGTLEVIYITPTDFRIIFLGKVIGNLLLGIFSMLLSFVVLKFIFSLDIIINHPISFLLSLLLTILAFSVISMLMGYLFTLSRNSRLLMNILEYPVYILCGIMVPIEFLPSFLRIFSYILPPTWSAKLLRESIIGIENTNLFILNLVILVFLIIFFFIVSHFLYKKIDYETKIRGSLGVH